MTENIIEKTDKMLDEFKKDTGIWPPGRSMPAACNGGECEESTRIRAFTLWKKYNQLQAELAKHRWIPVSEGLPKVKKATPFVVTDGESWWEEWWCVKDTGGLFGWDENAGEVITHYKPIILPEGE